MKFVADRARTYKKTTVIHAYYIIEADSIDEAKEAFKIRMGVKKLSKNNTFMTYEEFKNLGGTIDNIMYEWNAKDFLN